MRFILAFLLCITACTAREWFIKVHPAQVWMVSSNKLRSPQWFAVNHQVQNMVNLSFFNSHGYLSPYKDDYVTSLARRQRRNWGCISITDFNIHFSLVPTAHYIATGYPVLIREGDPVRLRRTFFTRRSCPRTIIAKTWDNEVLIYISTATTLVKAQKRLLELGCTDALNMDGGSSTFIMIDGVVEYSAKLKRVYPNVLVW